MNSAISLQLLEWDTGFFGFGIGRLETAILDSAVVVQTKAWCSANGVRCVYFIADNGSAAAERAGFLRVDTRLTYGIEPTRQRPDPLIRPQQDGDVRRLKNIATSAHRDGRFYQDPNFGDAAASRFYEAWIENACDGFADVVLVADEGSGAAGYITCRAEARTGTIGLVGVASDYRGRGIGSRLVQASLDWFSRAGLARVDVATQQRNHAARNLYEGRGFELVRRQAFYHYWP